MIKNARNLESVIDVLCNIYVTDNEVVDLVTLNYENTQTLVASEKEATANNMFAIAKSFKLETNKDPLTDNALASMLAEYALDYALKSNIGKDRDLDLSFVDETAEFKHRKLYSRINLVSNDIAINGRSGPATAVMAHTDVIGFIKGLDGSKGPSAEFAIFNNYKLIAYDKCEDNVVVLRKSECSATLLRHNEDIFKYMFIPIMNEGSALSMCGSFKVKLN